MSWFRPIPLPVSRFSEVLIAAVVIPCMALSQTAPKAAERGQAHRTARATEHGLPLVFEQNVGQLPKGTAFAGVTQNYTVELRPNGLRFEMAGKRTPRTIQIEFDGSQGGQPAGVSEAGFQTNLYMGKDPSQWHAGIRNFDRIALRKVYPGIDAEFYAHGGEIEHDFILAPGADSGLLKMHLSGAAKMEVSAGGDVVLGSEDGTLRLHKPSAYQVLADGSRKPVDAAFALTADGDEAELRFALAKYDHSRQLVIDPVISYATYVAGSLGSTPSAVTADSAGNVYLTGSTSSPGPSFYAASTGGTGDPVPPIRTTFIAKLSSAASGSQIAWLTYYGSTTASTVSTSIALQATSSTLYVGGTVGDAALPMGATPTFDSTPAPGASQYGFIGSFAAGTGLFSAGTYIEGGQTTPGGTSAVSGLAVSSGGSLTASGYTSGPLFPTSTTPAPLIASNDPIVQSPAASKGIVVTLDPLLVTEQYGTYVCGDTCLTTNTSLSGVGLDSVGNIYISGSTTGDFPQAGQYVAAQPTATPPVPGSAPLMNMPPATKTPGASDAFLAEIVPATQTVAYSFWSGGTGNDAANGVTLGSGGDAYLFGSTSSVDLVTNATTTSGTAKSGTTTTPLDANYPALATTSGFLAHVDPTGQLTATTYLGGTSSAAPPVATASSANGVAADASGNIYVAGYTSAAKRDFPQQTNGAATVAVTGEPLLPALEDVSADSPAAGPTNRGYLVEMPGSLGAVTYLANLGPSVGTSMAVGVAVDGAAVPNAYVWLQDTPGATGASFTTASAAEQTPQSTTGSTPSAYLAQIAFQPAQANPAIVQGTDSSSPNPIFYQSTATPLAVTLTWNIVGNGATGANGLVFNLPYSPNLNPYTSVPAVTVGGATVANVCTLGTSNAANPNPGITCVLPGLLPTGVTAQFVLQATLSPAATSTSSSTFSIPASAFDDQGDQIALTQSVTATQVPTLTLTATVSTAGPVNATSGPGDTTTPNTAVTYTFTISNSSMVAATNVSLATNLPAAFQASSPATITPAGCDPTTTTCTVPANNGTSNGTLTYSVTGVFVGTLLPATGPCPYTETVTSPPSVSFGPAGAYTPVYITPPTAPGPVTVNCNAKLSASVTGSGFTFPVAAPTAWTLGDTNRTIVATVTNSGPNPAGAGSVTIALPHGFTMVSATATGTPGTTFPTPPCAPPSGSSLTCSYNSLPGTAAAASASNVAFTITGTFQDTGTTADAVPPPATSPTPTPTTVAASATSGPALSAASGVSAGSGTYSPPATYTGLSTTVNRVNALAVTVGASAATVNETNRSHTNEVETYTVSITNTGKSVTRGLYFTIPVSVVGSALPGSVAVALSPTLPPSPGPVSPANLLNCSLSGLLITCYENDLTATPGAPTVTPAGTTYGVTFTVTYDETSIPATQQSGKLSVLQSIGPYYAASTTNAAVSYQSPVTPAPAADGTLASASVTVQRSTALAQAYTVTRVGAAPAKFADTSDINLDEHIAQNAPGVNDTITVTATAKNSGPNDALGVVLTIPIPKYLNVVSVPAYCTFGGVTGPTSTPITALPSGAAGANMVCTPPTTTTAIPPTPPGTQVYVGQIAPLPSTTTVVATGAYPYTATSAPYDGNAFIVTFNAKYVDQTPTSGTVPGTHATGVEIFTAASLGNTDVDTQPVLAQPSVIGSAISPQQTVQRAAHISLTTFPVPVYTNQAPLPKDTVLVPGGQAEIAQAAPGMNALTHTNVAGKVYNCIRYVLTVTNSGPNYGDGSLNYAIDQGPFVPTQKVLGTPTLNPAPADCVGYNPSLAGVARTAAQSEDVGEVSYQTGTQVVNLDGFFDVGTLGAVNYLAATFKTSQFTTNDYNDSNVPATGSATTGDYAGKQVVTVVNTPFNSPNNDPLTPGFGVTPVGGTPQVSLIFSTVTSPGITAYAVTSSAPAAGLFPSGRSPNPPDNGATKQLYQAGRNPTYYNVPSTAIVPSTAANPTSVCVSQAAGLPDVFVKPERSLLWIVQNAPVAQSYNPVPNISSAAPLAGDITTAVAPPVGAPAYTLTPAIAFPQVPQAQPAVVCGQMNGFPTSPTVAGAAPIVNAPTVTVLEPVNFPPYVVAGTGTSASAPVSKGATVGEVQVYLQTSPTQTHDFNDSDPCYIGGVRAKCDDNPYLFAFVFGGGNTGTSPEFAGPLLVSSLTPDPALGANAYDLEPPINLTGSAELFVAVADQATGADANNTKISPNPFGSQNFVTGNGTVCDPGVPSAGNYGLTPSPSVSGLCSPSTVADPTATVPTERYLPAGAPYIVGDVGEAQITSTATAGSGLIPLPTPVTPITTIPPTNPASGPAIAYLTPGQTAGFAWTNLYTFVQHATPPSTTAPTYTLGCSFITSLTNIAPPNPAPSPGTTCTISNPDPNAATPVTYSYNAASPNAFVPTILVHTVGNSYAMNVAPVQTWQRGLGEVMAALLFPLLFFRRRLAKGSVRLLLLLLAAGMLPLISGCGSSANVVSKPNVTASGTYYLIVTATPANPSLQTITSAPFEVVVQNPN